MGNFIMTTELWRRSALELATAIAAQELSSREVGDAAMIEDALGILTPIDPVLA